MSQRTGMEGRGAYGDSGFLATILRYIRRRADQEVAD
jgi:hypothetical protein